MFRDYTFRAIVPGGCTIIVPERYSSAYGVEIFNGPLYQELIETETSRGYAHVLLAGTQAGWC